MLFLGLLSGGALFWFPHGGRQLLAIARGLLTGSDILVLDEPSEGLAPLVIEDAIVGTVGQLAKKA